MLNEAHSLASLGEYEKALVIFLKKESYYNTALCYEKLGDLANAVKYYKIASVKSSAKSNAFNNLGNIYLHKGEFKKAVSYYQKALKIKRLAYLVLDNLGTAYRELGKLEKAVSYYQKALAINSKHNLALNNLELSLMKTCDWNSIQKYNKYFKKSKRTPFLSIITTQNPKANFLTAKQWQKK